MKKISPEEEQLWKAITEGVQPLVKERRPFFHASPRLDKHGIRNRVDRARRCREEALHTSLPVTEKSQPKRNANSKQIKSLKKIHLDGKIDLHDYTRDEAWVHLQRFFSWAQNQGYQWVLVITGRGPRKDTISCLPGILKREVPLWLDQHPQVGAFCPAKPEHGGQGAFYVRLKKRDEETD